jgi:serine/threonine protein kinase
VLDQERVPERIIAGKTGPRILVAEDDPQLRSKLLDFLCTKNRVIAVSDGKTALAEATTWNPHLVISDVMMPKLDGIEFCSKLRQNVDLANTAVLMLTARANLSDRIEGRRAGADTYLTKPFKLAEFEATVEGLLRARHHLVGDFLVRQPIGSGGQSKVFLAEHRITGRLAALKRITAKRTDTSAHRKRLQLEIDALTLLDHPNIVKIFAGYEQQGDFFLAMEYLSGNTVSALLQQQGPLCPEVTATIGSCVAIALDSVHQTGLVHRDVKCSNIMLLTEGRLQESVRLIDFGCAAFSTAGVPQFHGTPHYLAPEVARGLAPASPVTDVYSLGVTLFKMCTGELPNPPFGPQTHSRGTGLNAVRHATHLRSDIPPSLDRTIARAIALEPTDRWSSAAALAEALLPLSKNTGKRALKITSSRPDIITPTDSL